jgi:hypothetical protein
VLHLLALRASTPADHRNIASSEESVVNVRLRQFATAEPVEVLDFLREYHGALGPLVSQFEGTLDQFSSDGE